MTTLDAGFAAPAASGANAPARRVSSFRWLLKKELWDHFHGRRVWFGALLCVILSLIAVTLRVSDYRAAHMERNAFLQRWRVSVEEQLERDEAVQVENTRAVSPLSVLTIGLEPVMPFRFASTKEGLRFGETRGARNSVDALFGYLDISFIVSTLLSLMAITLCFDAVCGERALGTLQLLLSYPVPRSRVLLAKLVAALLVLAMSFLPALALVFVALLLTGVPVMSVAHWLIYAVLALLYAFVFAAAGLAVSARAKRPSDAALVSIFVWALLVFVVPRGVALAVNGLHDRSAELAVAEDAVTSQLKLDYARKEQQAFDAYFAAGGGARGGDTFSEQRKAAQRGFREKRNVALRRLWDQQDADRQSRERITRALSTVSPTALFDAVAAELSWTGVLQRDRFLAEARAYDERIGRPLAESREVYFTNDHSNLKNALVVYDDIKPYLNPFAGTWTSSPSILMSAVLPFAGLAAFAALFFSIAYVSFLRMDVRA